MAVVILLQRPDVVHVNEVTIEHSSIRVKAKRNPSPTAKRTNTPKAPKKSAALNNNGKSVSSSAKGKKKTKAPKRSNNKKAKVTEPTKAKKLEPARALQHVNANARANTKKRRHSMLVDTEDSDLSYSDDDNSSNF